MTLMTPMTASLLPQPHRLTERPGLFRIPVEGVIFIEDESFLPAAELLRTSLGNYAIRTDETHRKHAISVRHCTHKRSGYSRLSIRRDGIVILAVDNAAALSAVRTLAQLRDQLSGEHLQCAVIEDWPDFDIRGIYYDITRGRVPRVARVKEQICLLAEMKINHYQLYFEHTCFFPAFPYISKGSSPYSARDILSIDEFCKAHDVELVPSLATFGHMTRLLDNRHLRHLSEDLGRHSYVVENQLPDWQRKKAGTISPANPETYDFLERIFDDFLPLFSSHQFNVCCDEVFDLGMGQTHDLCKRLGKPAVFLSHVKKLRSMAKSRGKSIMLWGDMIHKHNLAKKLPKDVTVLDWAYAQNRSFKSLENFRANDCKTIACPGTSSWLALFPRLHEAFANINRTARKAKSLGASGLMTTDWGDNGHANLMEYSWLGYAYAADKAWNASSDDSTFIERFCVRFLKTSSPELTEAIIRLGDVSHTNAESYQSVWWHILAADNNSFFFDGKAKDAWISELGTISRRKIRLNPAFARRTLKILNSIRPVLQKVNSTRGQDPLELMPYWLLAIDLTAHSARKLLLLTQSVKPSKAVIIAQRTELAALAKTFKDLWMARNRKSEIGITLELFRKIDEQYQKMRQS